MTIQLISKTDCPFCVKAKALLNSNNLPFTELKIGIDITREEVLTSFPTMRTVPVITIDGKLLGGFNELSNIDLSSQERKIAA